jgi:hypothetical protein
MSGERQVSAWEYLFVEVRHEGEDLIVESVWSGEEDIRLADQYAHSALQILGMEGWELVAVDASGTSPWYVFKRPK